MSIPEITPTEFVARRQRGEPLTLLDVREDWEVGVANVPDTFVIEVADHAMSLILGVIRRLRTMPPRRLRR